jgi:hypothetical protein
MGHGESAVPASVDSKQLMVVPAEAVDNGSCRSS